MNRFLAAFTLLFGCWFLCTGTAAAQNATPVGVADAGCTVTPRSQAELEALNAASPVATPAPPAPPLLQGDPVDTATLDALASTLDQVNACAVSGDIGALFALYSDAYVESVALAPETVPIVPGSAPSGATPAATPPAGTSQPEIEAARMQPDGRVLAIVTAGGAPETTQYVVFVQQGEQWVIDGAGPVTSAELPDSVLSAIASDAGVSAEEVSVVFAESVDWPDTALGCPKEGEFYAEVITPGYAVLTRINGTSAEYHTDVTGKSVIRCDAS